MPGRVTMENYLNVMIYHPFGADQRFDSDEIRMCAQNLVEEILQRVPDCSDRTTAIRCVREALMWSNAAIALNGEI